MNQRLLSSLFFVCIVFGLGIKNIFGETKEASEILGKWVHWQYAYKDRDIRTMGKSLVPNHGQLFYQLCTGFEFLNDQAKNLFDRSPNVSKTLAPKKHTSQKITEHTTFNKLYGYLDNNIQGFLEYLKTHNFAAENINNHEQEVSIFSTIDKYKLFMRSLYHGQEETAQNEYLFATANRFFEFCFDEKSFNYFHELLENQAYHPIARFLYSVMWFHLVGEGWKDWHQNCLDALKKEHDQKKRITYIAGGNDIYQLIKNGIYNIDIIDPMLPSQPDYYAEGWLWLIKSHGLGDVLTFNFDNKSIIMKRAGYKEFELFDAALSTGDTVKIRHSKTTWNVYDAGDSFDSTKDNTDTKKNMKKLGTITIDRRFAKQADFVLTKKSHNVLLLSFNEMYFVDAPESFGGWGIDTSVVKPETKIFVKQLRKPITKSTWAQLRKADVAPFSFILLGSCAT